MRQDRVELRRQHLLIDLHDNGHTKSMIPTSEDVQVNLRQALTPEEYDTVRSGQIRQCPGSTSSDDDWKCLASRPAAARTAPSSAPTASRGFPASVAGPR
jgi:hypothetical protein